MVKYGGALTWRNGQDVLFYLVLYIYPLTTYFSISLGQRRKGHKLTFGLVSAMSPKTVWAEGFGLKQFGISWAH